MIQILTLYMDLCTTNFFDRVKPDKLQAWGDRIFLHQLLKFAQNWDLVGATENSPVTL